MIIKPPVPYYARTNPLIRGLVFDAPMYEGGGSTTLDIANRGSGTFLGATKPLWRYGVAGRGLVFDGSASYIEYAETSFLDLSVAAISLQCLFICTNTGAGGDMLAKPVSGSLHVSPYFSYSMHVTPSGVRTWLTTVGNASGVSTTEVAITQGALVNGISTYNGATIIQYVNGVNKASTSASGAIISSGTPLRISANGNLSEIFPGTIFLCRIWNRTLSKNEVELLSYNPYIIYRPPMRIGSLNSVAASAAFNSWRMMMGVGV